MEKKVSKKKSLRDELIWQGVLYLNTHSAQELTMRKMAELCHVTPHAIYNHFKNKDALLKAVSDCVVGQLTNYCMDILTRDSSDFAEKMTQFASAYLMLLERYPYHIQMLHSKDKDNDPYFAIEQNGDQTVFLTKYPGLPSLKTLDKISTLPPPILKGMLKLGKLAGRLKKAQSELTPKQDDPVVVRGQILMLAFFSGLQNAGREGLIPQEGREEMIRSMVHTLLERVL